MREEIPSLTGLRFFAAFAIVIHHLTPFSLGLGSSSLLGAFSGNNGILGMSLFFVLSGFIIHYNYYEKIAMKKVECIYDFFVARFSRLYPLFIAFFLIDAIYLFLKAALRADYNTVNRVLATIPTFVLGVQSWIYALVGNFSITYSYNYANITWSISTEFFFYMCYPIIGLYIGRICSGTRILTLICTLVAIHSIVLYYVYHGFFDLMAVRIWGDLAGEQNAISYRFSNWLGFLSPYTRLFEFLVGCSVAQLWNVLRDKPASDIERLFGHTMLFLSLTYVLISYIPFSLQPTIYRNVFSLVEYKFVIPIIIFGLVRYKTFLTSILSNRNLVLLGEASYSMYLLHIVIVRLLKYQGSQDNVFLMFGHAVLEIILIFALAVFCFRYIESPAKQWLRNALDRRTDRALNLPGKTLKDT